MVRMLCNKSAAQGPVAAARDYTCQGRCATCAAGYTLHATCGAVVHGPGRL